MDNTVLLTCLFIIAARIADVSLGTLRTVFVVQGRPGVSWVLGFFEILIWVFVVSKVIENLDQPAYAVSYALGYATGNYVGVTSEKWLAIGEQVVRIFTRQGHKMAMQLRTEGFRVTSFAAEGRDGPIEVLFIEIPRKKASDIIQFARQLDPKSFCLIEDVRPVSLTALALHQPTGWRAIFKKK